MLRYQPDEWMVHFVTTRCLQSRYLLRPSPRVRSLIVGVLERAAERTGCRLHAAVALSNHIHLVVSSRSAAHLADYMQFVNCNIAREVGKLHRWRDKFWQRRYQSGLCLDDESQIDRLAYALVQSVKERLVRSASHWPGLHTFRATCDGEKLHGHWVDRSAMYRASRRGDAVRESDFSTPCTLTLHKLPCWAHLGDATYASEARRIYHDRLAELGVDQDTPVVGAKAVQRRDPHDAPRGSDHSPAPLCHAAAKVTRDAFRVQYIEFVTAYREALAALRHNLDEFSIPEQGIPPGGLRAAPT